MRKSEGVRDHLRAGEFYGDVSRKISTSRMGLFEVIHKTERKLKKHSHKLASFHLMLNGNYLESYGSEMLDCAPMSVTWCPPGVTHEDHIGRMGAHFFAIEIAHSAVEML